MFLYSFCQKYFKDFIKLNFVKCTFLKKDSVFVARNREQSSLTLAAGLEDWVLH
jgi:hypothetical protein